MSLITLNLSEREYELVCVGLAYVHNNYRTMDPVILDLTYDRLVAMIQAFPPQQTPDGITLMRRDLVELSRLCALFEGMGHDGLLSAAEDEYIDLSDGFSARVKASR